MKENEIYTKISEFKRRLTDIMTMISFQDNTLFELFYKEHDLSPKFKITVEMVDEKFFIDSQGRRWIRADDR